MPITASFGALTYRRSISPEYYIGMPLEGGFYIGNIVDGGVTYRLIISPRSTQSGTKKWGPYGESVNANSLTNGPANTAACVAGGAGYEAAIYADNLNTGGYTDWYLPAKNELNVAYLASGVLTSIGQQVYSAASPATFVYLWTSTQQAGEENLTAWIQAFRQAPYVLPNGTQSGTRKDTLFGVTPVVRAFRRIPV